MLNRCLYLLFVEFFFFVTINSQPVNRPVVTLPNNQSEPFIAINPSNNNVMLATWTENINRSPGYAFSTDAGFTWTPSIILAHDGSPSGWDPSAAFDNAGTAYYCYAHTVSFGPVYVSRTYDFGQNWFHKKVSEDFFTYNDKPVMTVDNGNSQFNGRIYVSYTKIAEGGVDSVMIKFASSTDGGINFDIRYTISTFIGTRGGCAGVSASMPAVGPNGEVYVVWLDVANCDFNGGTYKIRKSTNGGLTFSSATSISNVTMRKITFGSDRAVNPISSLAVDQMTGILYLVYTDWASQIDTSKRIKFVRSTNNGLSWTSPLNIGNFAYGTWQFLPVVTSEPSGRVWITFMHSPNPLDTVYKYMDSYIVESTDGGVSFSMPTRVSSVSSYPTNITEHSSNHYIGMTAKNGFAYPIWTDYRNTSDDIYSAEVSGGPMKPLTNTSTATAYGSTPKSLYSTISNRWHSVFTSNANLYYVYSTDEGNSWNDYSRISGTVGGVKDFSNPTLFETGNGTLHVLFASEGKGLYYTSKTTSGNWTTPRKTRTVPTAKYPSFTVDGNGTGHVVFTSETAMEVPFTYLYYGNFNTADSTDTLIIRKTLSSGTGIITGISLTQVLSGGLHVIWSVNNEIYYKTGTGSSWSSTTNISNNTGSSVYPCLISTSDQSSYVLHAVWQDNTPGNNEIYYTTRTNLVSWQTPTNESNNSNNSRYPIIRATPWGGVPFFTIMWSDNRDNSDPSNFDIWYKIGQGTTPYRLSSTSALSNYPSLTFRTITNGIRLLPIWTESFSTPYLISSSFVDYDPFGKRIIASREQPTRFELMNNYPNPFNPMTTIKYSLSELVHARLSIYNTLGQEVATLVNDVQEAGFKSVEWDASSIPSGVYFYKLTAGSFINTKKMLLVR
ncbi:MAG: T9SS type A sorting domain-containing protein [Ignavibacteriae bacterium]|nr:T9SS type A sorting domain-containing protein [Ignavibacteriota bacterium]